MSSSASGTAGQPGAAAITPGRHREGLAMKNHRSFAAGVVALGSALLLAGCSGWSYQPPMRGNVSFAPSNLGKLRAAAPQNPSSFSQALTADYASFAGALEDEHHDWADADYFARKGLAASRGE